MADSISIFRGDDKTFQGEALDENDAVVDLTGTTSVKFSVKKDVNAKSLIFQKTLGSGVTIVSAAAGLFEIDIVPVDTAGLLGEYVYDVEFVLASGKTHTDVGVLTVKGDVTP